ncbi:hypothetical protein Tco_1393890 [Tanacetum coccineum]
MQRLALRRLPLLVRRMFQCQWVTADVESISKASTSGMQMEGQSSTHVVDKINRIEKYLMEGKCVLMDDDGKPLEKLDSLADHDSDDEVASVDNDMA